VKKGGSKCGGVSKNNENCRGYSSYNTRTCDQSQAYFTPATIYRRGARLKFVGLILNGGGEHADPCYKEGGKQITRISTSRNN